MRQRDRYWPVNYGTITHHLMEALRVVDEIPPASDEERAQLAQARRQIINAIGVVRNCHHRGR